MNLRALLGAGGLALLAAVALAPPVSAEPPRGRWTVPLVENRYLEEPTPLTGVASDPDGNGVQDVTFNIDAPETPDDPCRPVVDAASQTTAYPGDEGTSEVRFSFEPTFPCNRTYRALATVRSQPGTLSGSETTVLELVVGIAYPPVAVSGVQAEYHQPESDPDGATSTSVPADSDGGSGADGEDDGDSGSTTSTSSPTTSTTSKAASAEGKRVEVRWERGPEVDLLGYVVQRSVSGGGWSTVAELEGAASTAFVDRDVDSGGRYRYRVTAVRSGPDDARPVLASPVSEPASVEVPGPPTTTTSTTAGDDDEESPDVSGFAPQRVVTHTPGTRPPMRSRTRTTVDTGFQQELDFGETTTTAEDREEVSAPPLGDGSVVAQIEIEGEGDADPRAVLVPVAGGLALFVGAMHLRYLNRRASLPHPDAS